MEGGLAAHRRSSNHSSGTDGSEIICKGTDGVIHLVDSVPVAAASDQSVDVDVGMFH